jgi:hypothetical protein
MKEIEYVARMEDVSNACCHSLAYAFPPSRFITGIDDALENRLIGLSGQYK